eukprot:g5712.t1
MSCFQEQVLFLDRQGLLQELDTRLRTVKRIRKEENEIMKYRKLLGPQVDHAVFPDQLSVESVSLLSELELHCQLEVDEIRLKVPLPSSLFQEKDYLQNLYFWKKYCFLKTLVGVLSSSSSLFGVTVVYLRGDLRTPGLKFSYQSVHKENQKVLLIPYLKEDVFPARRFLIERNSLREYRNKEKQLLPTPYCNFAILKDITLVANVKRLKDAFDHLSCRTAVQDALILIKLWCRSHWLESSDGFDSLTWGLIVLRGLQLGLITTSGVPLDLFYGVLSLLSSSKPLTKVSKHSEHIWKDSINPMLKLDGSDQLPSYECMKSLNMECFLDVTGYYNCTFDVSSSWMEHLKATAKRTLALLQKDQFHSITHEVFNKRLPLRGEFDSVVEVELEAVESGSLLFKDKPEVLVQLEGIERVLKRGLTDRWSVLRFLWNTHGDWTLTESTMIETRRVWICLKLSKENSNRLIDRGPSPEDKAESKKFRKFWKKKSELKKFSDGTICETVSWNLNYKELIVEQIFCYLLSTQFSLEAKICSITEAELGDLQQQSNDFRKLQKAYRQLTALLKGMKNLALRVISVQEIDAVFRNTKCFLPLSHPIIDEAPHQSIVESSVSRCVDPVHVLVNLEGSGSWPVNEEAYQKTKIAIQVQMSKELNKQGYHCRVHEELIDLFLHSFVFRLYLATERDENQESDSGIKRKILERNYHGLIFKVASQHESYSLAVKLLQSWFSRNYFDFHFDSLVLELIMIHIYTCPSTRSPPVSSLSAFFRALYLIGTFPWRNTPLVVDLDSEMTDEELRGVEDWYKQDTGERLLAVCTPFDRTSSLTDDKPLEKSVLSRLIHLAEQTVLLSCPDLASVFHPNCTGFDIIIYLKQTAIPNPDRQYSVHASNRQSRLDMKTGYEDIVVVSHIPLEIIQMFSVKQIQTQLLIGFDPVQKFLKLLTQHFGYVGIFCYDQFGGDRILIRWKPEMLIPIAEPEISELAYWCQTETGFVPDITSILSDVLKLGRGLVKYIEAL